MGCNCGGKGKRSSPLTGGSSSRELPQGFTAATAILVGDDNAFTRRVKVYTSQPALGLRSSQTAWVKGTGVQALIDGGAFIDIGNRNLLGRAWRVGEFDYLNYADAQDAHAATGLPIVEIL